MNLSFIIKRGSLISSDEIAITIFHQPNIHKETPVIVHDKRLFVYLIAVNMFLCRGPVAELFHNPYIGYGFQPDVRP